MRRIVHKWFWVWNYQKEEKWLNEMSAKGLALIATGFCRYEFEDAEPGEYKIGLECLETVPTHPEMQKYLEFLDGTGVEMVGKLGRWVYLRTKNEGEFALFSDNESKIKHLNRILTILIPVCVMDCCVTLSNLCMFLANRFSGSLAASAITFLVVLLIVYGIVRILLMRSRLKKESSLFE